jgi:hypothetical protein
MTLAHTNYNTIDSTHTIDSSKGNPNNPNELIDSGIDTIATDADIKAVTDYQAELQTTVANRESINKDINDQLGYTMMAMTIWVPLGIFVGYYLYSRGSSSA